MSEQHEHKYIPYILWDGLIHCKICGHKITMQDWFKLTFEKNKDSEAPDER